MTFAWKLLDQYTFIQYAEFCARLVVACACGAIIGFERSKRFKEAGIRTHIIVCCAAALVMILSKYGFADLIGPGGEHLVGTNSTDPARRAAQIITGVSFLGAGIIFHNGSSVKGLTTAAGIWATAGIGLAIGSGMYILGIFTTIIVDVIQIIMHKHTIGVDSMRIGRLRCTTSSPDAFRQQLDEYIDSKGMQILDVKIEFSEDGTTAYELTLRMGRDMTISDMSGFLESMDNVKAISFEMENS